ncbi:MAG TPA: hypothetical protein DEF36_08900 [Desulfotomaculum sp.]|nr:hypothetical protein [Desulfotomaculum sp.]
MKKMGLILVIIAIVGLISIPVYGASATKVNVNGVDLEMKETPVVINGRTLVPLREIFEALNVTPQWDNNTNSVTAKSDTVNMRLTIDSNTALVNNKPVQLEVPGTLVNGRTMVPARFIAETFGGKVEWDDATKTVLINTPSQTGGSKSSQESGTTAAAQQTNNANAYKHLLKYMKQFEGSQFNNVIRVGNLPTYRSELSEVKIVIKEETNSSAKYDPVSDTITLSEDPARVLDEDSLDMGMLVWHELTHKIENTHGDMGVLDNKLYAERNIEYMKHIIGVALPWLEKMERDTNADDAKIREYWSKFVAAFDSVNSLPEVQEYPPNFKLMKEWFDFSVDKDAILEFYQSGKAGERFKKALADKPAADWAGNWETNFGTMSLTQSGTGVNGSYAYQSGSINGTVTGNMLTGTWAETDDRGTFTFTLSADGKSFSGSWKETSPDPNQGGGWDGSR